MDYVGPEPALGLSLANIKHEISQWSVQEQNKRWRNIKSCRQSKQFMQVVNIRLTQYAVRLSTVIFCIVNIIQTINQLTVYNMLADSILNILCQ